MPQPSFNHNIGSPFIELQSVDSTNNYARQQIQASRLTNLPVNKEEDKVFIKHGTVFFAHEQVAGKGQRGKTWVSEKNLNLAMSIIVTPGLFPLNRQFQLSACVAVSVQEVFMKYAGDESKIKWPNDLYWQDRKAGGILIESIISSGEDGKGSWDWAIIGIGININQVIFPADIPNPVSLRQITGKMNDPLIIAKEICGCFEKNYYQILNNGFEEIYTIYNSNLYKRNEIVKLKKGNRIFEVMIKKVSPSGQLITEHPIEEAFDFGAVEWLI